MGWLLWKTCQTSHNAWVNFEGLLKIIKLLRSLLSHYRMKAEAKFRMCCRVFRSLQFWRSSRNFLSHTGDIAAVGWNWNSRCLPIVTPIKLFAQQIRKILKNWSFACLAKALKWSSIGINWKFIRFLIFILQSLYFLVKF